MDFTIRLAWADDIPTMHRLRLSVMENRLSDPARITEDSYRPYVEDGGAWVAEAASEIVGFAVVDEAEQSLWALFVRPDMERLGIGGALFGCAAAWASERGIRTLGLVTEAGTRAERFYEAAGLKRAGLSDTGEVRFQLVQAEQTRLS